jgi:hypothetical protein
MKDYYFFNRNTQEYIQFNTEAIGIYTILEILERHYEWKNSDDIRIFAFSEGYDVTKKWPNAKEIEVEDD